MNAHPEGCRRNIARQIAAITAQATAPGEGLKNAMIIGASAGYGLASRIAAGWGFQARTLGVFLERQPDGNKTGTAGYYNTVAFHEEARRAGLFAASVNADAFSNEAKRSAIEIIRREMGRIDLLIYSLAAPKRVHPQTGKTHNSVLKPVGEAYTNKTIELDSEKVIPVTIPPATEEEVADTVAVMGGDDWRQWTRALLGEGLFAQGARTLAYSYIGPQLTWPIYRDGTIGRAKKDLESTARELDAALRTKLGGAARVAVNKAIVTQASSAIPVVPLYMSLLFRVMKEKGLHEIAIEQIRRLFFDFPSSGKSAPLDAEGRIRLDGHEMRADVQAAVTALWPRATTETLRELSDFSGFQHDFRSLFGFEVEGVDYSEPVETDASW